MAKIFNIDASVHKELASGYRVKVSVVDLGMYINGMVVFQPNDDHKDWSVMTPAMRSGRGNWTHVVEFNKNNALWEEIYLACVQAAKQYVSEQDVVLLDISDEPMSFDNIDTLFN